MKDLKGYENLYKIAEDGTIYLKERVCYNPRYGEYILKEQKVKTSIKRGYLTCMINQKMKCVHRLIYETYVGDIPKGCVLHHINENKLDNRIENLICMTREEHIAHHNNTGVIYGKRKSDLTEEQTNKVIELSKKGLSNRKVADIVGCGKSTVQRIYKAYLESQK